MVKEFNVLMTGVGGQGVILMSELLGNAAVKDGLKVRGSEILGMAVRGGSVTSMIRLGEDVYGPLIPEGKADVLLSMELSEAPRNITYLSKSSSVIVSIRRVVPIPVLLGMSHYASQEEIVEKLKEVVGRVITLDATQIAQEAGNLLTANVVMLGALFSTGQLPIKVESMKEQIQAHFPAKVAPVNLKAFDLGYQVCQQAVK